MHKDVLALLLPVPDGDKPISIDVIEPLANANILSNAIVVSNFIQNNIFFFDRRIVRVAWVARCIVSHVA
jgi:hypothetical protein